MSSPWDQPGPILARFQFHVTRDDVAAAYRLHMRWRYTRPASLVWPLALALVALAATAAIDPGSTPWALPVPVAVILGGTVAVRLLSYACAPLSARRVFRQQKNLSQPWEVELTADGVRARTPSQDLFVAWADYVAYSEDRHVILLYQSDLLFQLMPKRAVGADSPQTLRRRIAHLPKR